MAKLRVGLAGCGRIARLVHLQSLTSLPDFELVALAESDPARRREAARRAPRAAAYASYGEMLKDSSVEAVLICLPNALHAAAAVDALRAGRHVYLEKPLATDLGDARAVLDVWRRSRLVGMMGFNFRFNFLHQSARLHVERKTVGEIVCARTVFSSAARALPEWKKSRRTGGGVLLDLASHHIDLARYLFRQEVRRVFAEVRSRRSEGDGATLELRLADGVLVQSFFSAGTADEDRFEFYGTGGKLAFDRYHSGSVEVSGPARAAGGWRRVRGAVASLKRDPPLVGRFTGRGREPSFALAASHFAAAVRGEAPASPDFEDGYRSLAVVAAAEESARTGRAVRVSDSDEGPAD